MRAELAEVIANRGLMNFTGKIVDQLYFQLADISTICWNDYISVQMIGDNLRKLNIRQRGSIDSGKFLLRQFANFKKG